MENEGKEVPIRRRQLSEDSIPKRDKTYTRDKLKKRKHLSYKEAQVE